jgi:hypothetical protein
MKKLFASIRKYFYLKFFHKRHVFFMKDAVRGDSQCRECGKWLSELQAAKGILIALVLLCSVHADTLLPTPGGYAYNAPVTVRIVVQDSACDPCRATLCVYKCYDTDLSPDFKALPGDTAKLSFTVPAKMVKSWPDSGFIYLSDFGGKKSGLLRMLTPITFKAPTDSYPDPHPPGGVKPLKARNPFTRTRFGLWLPRVDGRTL